VKKVDEQKLDTPPVNKVEEPYPFTPPILYVEELQLSTPPVQKVEVPKLSTHAYTKDGRTEALYATSAKCSRSRAIHIFSTIV
jgi:hypothetical protein